MKRLTLLLLVLCLLLPASAIAESQYPTIKFYANNYVAAVGDTAYVKVNVSKAGSQAGTLELRNQRGEVLATKNYKPGAKPTASPNTTPAPTSTTDAAKVLSDMNWQFTTAKKVSPYTVVARPSRASGWVNLRWAPTTEAERIATCPQGKELTVLVEMKSWYQVQDPETGMIGFISNQYVVRK